MEENRLAYHPHAAQGIVKNTELEFQSKLSDHSVFQKIIRRGQ